MIVAEERKNDWLKISQFLFSLTAFLITTICAAGSFAGGLIFYSSSGFSAEESGGLVSLGSLSILLAVFHFSALVNAVKEPALPKSTGHSKINSFILASAALLCWAVILILTYFHIGEQFFNSIQPFFTPLAIWIPIWWFIEFGKRKLPQVTARKSSAALSIGSSYTIFIIMVLELIVVALIIAIVLIYLNSQPQIQQWMKTFTFPRDLTQLNEQVLERYLNVIIQNPIFIAAVFLLVGIIAPFIEESLKPLALWTLRKRSLSPSEGFILGLYFGAAFAFVESAGMVIQLGTESWAESILLRASTSLLHITCSGLVSHGYVRSMQPGKNSAFLKPLLAALALHGTWNSLAVLVSLASLSPGLNIDMFFTPFWDKIFIIALILEWSGILFLLWKMNKKMKDDAQLPEPNTKGEGGVLTNEVE
jgi:hypothetical protein